MSRWKIIIGGALPQGLAKAALERGIDVFVGYGIRQSLNCSEVPGNASELKKTHGLPCSLQWSRLLNLPNSRQTC